MDKKVAGLLGAAAALTTVTAAQAAVPVAPAQLNPPASYADLLTPVPQATAALRADNARLIQTSETVIVKKKRYHHHHHHHHHHHGAFIGVPGVGGVSVGGGR